MATASRTPGERQLCAAATVTPQLGRDPGAAGQQIADDRESKGGSERRAAGVKQKAGEPEENLRGRPYGQRRPD